MDMVIPFAEVLLAAAVHATLQLGLGAFLLLYHASLGKHIRQKTRNVVDSYIAGAGTMVFIMQSRGHGFYTGWVFWETTFCGRTTNRGSDADRDCSCGLGDLLSQGTQYGTLAATNGGAVYPPASKKYR